MRKVVWAVRKVVWAVRKVVWAVRKVVWAVRKVVWAVRKVVWAVRKVVCFLETTSVVGVDGNSAGLFFYVVNLKQFFELFLVSGVNEAQAYEHAAHHEETGDLHLSGHPPYDRHKRHQRDRQRAKAHQAIPSLPQA